jgi:hypothetical protein
MAEFKITPRTGQEKSDSKSAAEVLLSVVVGLGLVLILAVVLAFGKCISGYSHLRGKWRRSLSSLGSTARITDGETRSVVQ